MTIEQPHERRAFFGAPAAKVEGDDGARAEGRTRTREQTLAILLPRLAEFGITRLANVTGLDAIGMPVYQAIRPNARSLAVAQGKGVDVTSAKISAVMEALESYHAEHARCPVRIETHRVLSREARVADPMRLSRSRFGHYHADATLPWAEGRALATGEPAYVPFELVHANYTVPRVPGSGIFVPSSNGMGAGNHASEAALHGVLELVERDAETLWRIGGEPLRRATRVAIESVTASTAPNARALVDRLRDAGLEVMIWDMTSDVRLACLSVVVFDLDADPELNPRPAAEGSGCHFDREVALCRALVEAVQSRLTSIAGSRDDFNSARYRGFQSKASLDHWRAESARSAALGFDAVPHAAAGRVVDDDLSLVVERLAERGMDEIVYVDLSSPSLDLTFLRMVVAGLEGSMTSPSYVPGARASEKLASRDGDAP